MTLDVRIGINPISWTNDDLPSLGGETPLETALADGRKIGYAGFELGGKFPREPAALRAKLAEFGLACVSGWYSGRLARRSVDEEIEAVGPHLRLLVANGADVMVYGEVADAIQGLPVPLYKRPRFASDAQWREYGDKLTRFAQYTFAKGVRLGYHHHMGAYVQSPDDIDTLMAVTGRDVGLLFDTGHVTFGGGEAGTVLRRHIDRVCHVHCKDVRPGVLKLARNRQWSFLESVLNGVFTVPGDGMVDFSGVIALLNQRNYRGWLVVEAEQDPAVAPSYACAERGYRHLRELVAKANGKGIANA